MKNELLIRKNKLLNSKNKNLFPNNFKSKDLKLLISKYKDKSKEILKIINLTVNVSGRIIYRRKIGKLTFIKIQDINESIQIYISVSEINHKEYVYQDKLLDIGDIIWIKGILFRTKTDELSIKAKKIILLVKCLKSLPDKFHGLKKNEILYKKRYLDLISNKESRYIFLKRFEIINEIRIFLIKKKFIEVETPILQSIPGGADARPFCTKINFSKKKLYLRISPELYLKKLIIGGFNKIFEISKNFRNEGISKNHNPEFTMIELYMSYSKYDHLIKLIQDLFKYLCKKIFNKYTIKYKNNIIDFSKSFNKLDLIESICIFTNISKKNINNINTCIEFAKSIGLNICNDINNISLGKIQLEIFKKCVENKLINPTFILNYPIEVSPLSRRKNSNKKIADRFELFICGVEIGNGFSELNDSEDQLNRFKDQLKYKKNKKYDFNYIEALEYGLPPTAGLGLGIDRIIMLLTNSDDIKDVILFPTIHYK
ncbi:lysine-tRNA ligase [endosymbiont of Sipalinus gigas]|uniref:lysine--tRNA ligase n=1 Tax=endosymbiont of Sipalinus gigas TaxID=1972134 RepID=UPI000DC6EF4A|nr:lysine--tRNA ligase [endosymbiont of Sipalinus gigas]BBA85162.1 lysine-tRNA ligase [endosymbiont of Sipalinus gigas]